MNKKSLFILLLIVIIATFFRFYELGKIPAGMHADAASQAYNAFSILSSGKDQYGEPTPILFRANGSYQPPLYTYITIIPILIFGHTIFSAHFLSAFSGVLLVLITYFFLVSSLDIKTKTTIGLISAFIVAVSPWSIFFSRLVIEANLSLLIFACGVVLLTISSRKIKYFPIACLMLGLTTHAYYSEQVTVLILLPLFIFLFRKYYLRNITLVLIGLGVFVILQLPHIITIQSGAFTRRFSQVSYVQSQTETDIQFINNLLSRITRFTGQYLNYFMPNNLFFNYNPSLGRTIPDMGVFNSWFLIPFLIGIKHLYYNKHRLFTKIILLLAIITPIPAGLTGDQFYPLRTLSFLWIISIIISLGVYDLLTLVRTKKFALPLFAAIFLYSILSLYISYFILYKYANPQAQSYGYSYVKLIDYLPKLTDKHIIIDSSRDIGIGLRIAYLTGYNPIEMQKQLRIQLKSPYYSNIVNAGDVYTFNNIEIKPIKWSDTCNNNTVIIGDLLSISDQQAAEYQLKQEFIVEDITGNVALKAYSTHPRSQCQKSI